MPSPPVVDAGLSRGKRIVHINTTHPQPDVRMFYKLCATPAAAGFDVHAIVRWSGGPRFEGVTMHALPEFGSRTRRMAAAPLVALRKLLSLRPRPDLVVLSSAELIPLAGLISRLGFRVCMDVSEDWAAGIRHRSYIPVPLRRPLSQAFRRLEDRVTSEMPVTESDGIEGRFSGPYQTVRNLPPVSRMRTRKRTREDFEGRARLFYAGAIYPYRGLWEMLRLAQLLLERGRDVELHVIGPCPLPDVEARARAWVREQGLQERIRLPGRIEYEEVLRVTADATLGLSLLHPHPNYTYALPQKLIEFMAAGVPYLASDLPCTRRYVEAGGGGVLVDPSRIEAVADTAEALLDDPDRLVALSEAGRASALEGELNWEHEAGVLVRFYRRLLGEDLQPDPCFFHRPLGSPLLPAPDIPLIPDWAAA